MAEEIKEKFSFIKKFLMIVGIIAIIFVLVAVLVMGLLFFYLMNNKPL